MMETIVRCWVAIVGATALVTSLQCFMDSSFLADRIYTLEKEAVNPALGRLFGTWTSLAGVVRILCAVYINSKPLYIATLFSFLLAFVYFSAEFLVYKTATLTVGIVSPLVVAGGSIVLMLVAYRGIFKEQGAKDATKLQSKKP